MLYRCYPSHAPGPFFERTLSIPIAIGIVGLLIVIMFIVIIIIIIMTSLSLVVVVVVVVVVPVAAHYYYCLYDCYSCYQYHCLLVAISSDVLLRSVGERRELRLGPVVGPEHP